MEALVVIRYATTNAGKVQSLTRVLAPYGIEVLQCALDLAEPRSSDVREIAEAKVRAAYDALKEPVVALDAGFYIPALNGFPRAYVYFALETVGLEGILTLLAGKPRACEFRECLAYFDGTLAAPKCFIARIPGTVAEAVRGRMAGHLWSPCSLVFIPEGETRTLAEMTPEEYAHWSTYQKGESASREFAEWFIRHRSAASP